MAAWRTSLKVEIFHQRSELYVVHGRFLQRAPRCPICGLHVQHPDMHESIITRGQVAGSDLEHKIFVGVNVNLLHPGECHLSAQHTPEGKLACLVDILMYNPLEELLDWLQNDMADLQYAAEAYRWVIESLKPPEATYVAPYIDYADRDNRRHIQQIEG